MPENQKQLLSHHVLLTTMCNKLPSHSGENGLILKGCYCSINVAVKRLLPPSTPGYPSVFGKTVAENQKKLQGGKAGPKVRRLSAAKAKGCDSRPHSPLLASTDSQVGSKSCMTCFRIYRGSIFALRD